MRAYFPVLILGAIIGVFTLIFVAVYALEKNKKETMGFDRHMADGEIVKRLLRYARPYYKQFIGIFFIMLFSIGYDLGSPQIIGHLIETVQGDFELSYLLAMVLAYAGILIVSLACTYAQAMILQKFGQ